MGETIIRRAEYEDVSKIMRFIDCYWKENHILARDRDFFEWQYVRENQVNFIIGICDEEIQGILGFIPYGTDIPDLCLALWKAKEGTGILGISILLYLTETVPHRTIFCNGINVKTTAPIYSRLGYLVTRMQQWYRLAKRNSFRIAEIKNLTDDAIPKRNDNWSMNIVRDVTSLRKIWRYIGDTGVPQKDISYFIHRYYEHPIYEYNIYSVTNNDLGEVVGLCVFRQQEYAGSKCLRLIDYVGEHEFLYTGMNQVDELIGCYDVEYIDMYEYGLSVEELLTAGWKKVGDDENVIPNYFSPFERKNVTIDICTLNPDMVIFKGDGDQDRPS